MRDYEFYYTQDGSIGLFSHTDDDVYHSKYGALTESWQKFVLPSGIMSVLNRKQNVKILDLCYGIGYNTKALMSYVINADENVLKKKNKFKNNLKIFLKNFGENLKNKFNIDTIHSNNILVDLIKLLESIETIELDKLTKFQIDCLEINDELVKISPLLKTIITPQEIFSRIVPHIFTCFDSYWKIKKFLSKFVLKIAPRNKRKISERLNLKFNNDYDEVDREYRIHKFVNYILANSIIKVYKNDYWNKSLESAIYNRENYKFFDKSMLRYVRLKQKLGYNYWSRFDLLANLHNIYYEQLSKRYNKTKYNDAESLFKLNFYVDDARRTILALKDYYDYIFLDAFTYSKAPELWSMEFMKQLYDRLSPHGLIMTYSNSALVRHTLLENTFYVGKIKDNKTGKFIGTVAAKDKSLIEYPLSNYEIGLCNTRTGIPYHDPGLSLPREEILRRREFEFKNSDLLTATQYMKRRTLKDDEEEDES